MFQGDLSLISMPNLLQLFYQEKKTGIIYLSNKNDQVGKIFLKDGDIIAAETQGLKGKEALFKLVNLKKGKFLFKEEYELPPVQINESCEALLLEALRHEDEAKELKEKLLNRFKDEISRVEKVEWWTELFIYLNKLREVLDMEELEYIWIKNDVSSLVFFHDKGIIKADLHSDVGIEEVAEKIKKEIRS